MSPMEPSPLTRQPPPEVFTPKVVQLYQELFKDDEDGDEKPEGFWREFFLLRSDTRALKRELDALGQGDGVLQHEARTRELFARAVAALKAGRRPSDLHALETLKVFLSTVLSKKYAHASSDVITLLTGIDRVDAVFSDFVAVLEGMIRAGRDLELRHRAVDVVLAITAGAYQTTLLTYLIQRDLFPSIMKLIQDLDTQARIVDPFILLGLLANYNKFEFQNPYQLRLADFVNEGAIQKIIRCVGYTCQKLRGDYLAVHEDLPEGWTLTSALNMLGLGAIAPGTRPEKRPVYDAETAREMYSRLPMPEAGILLATYDFTHTNKLFCFNLVTLAADAGTEPPLSSFISLTSYFLTHAHSSERATLYSHLSLMILRLLVEDPVLCKRLCSADAKIPIRLCRQRAPHLPLVRTERIPATCILDAMISGITHNLRKRLDVGLYTLCVGTMLRIISYLSRSRTRLAYHWNELFRALLSLVQFLTKYTDDFRGSPQIETLLDHVVNLLALSLSAGEAFLPSPSEYDDLFYKVVETGEVLIRFKQNYRLANRKSNSIDTLISVSSHYKQLLEEGGAGGKIRPAPAGGKGLTSRGVAEVIKQGYETLSIQTKEGLDTWERFREADERSLLKKMARAAVGDVRELVGR